MIRFLDINDYAQCANIIIDQKEFIEKYWKEDYRYWIQPLAGWLHPEPFERCKGSFLNQNKRLAGYFYDDKLISFAGLICYPKSDVAVYTYRVSNTHFPNFNSEKVYIEKTIFLFKWGISIGKKNFFGCRHPELTKNITTWINRNKYLSKKFQHQIIASYDAYEIPTNSWHYEIMEFSPIAFPVEILHWSYK